MARRSRLLPGCDIKSLPLTPAEAFLLTRMDITTDERELALITGFPADQVAVMLDRLASMGAIELADRSGSQTRLQAGAQPGGKDKLSGIYPATVAQPARASTATMNAVSATSARRPSTAELRAQAPTESLVADYERATAEARRVEVARCIEQGKIALDRGDYVGAISAYRRASSLAPDDARVQATCNQAIQQAAAPLADEYWEQAVREEREERWEAAALSYSKVCVGRPTDALAHERVANAALRSSNVRRAVEFARKAIELAPGEPIFHIALARAYAAAGLEKSAHGELDRARDLAGDDEKIRGVVSRARASVGKGGKVV